MRHATQHAVVTVTTLVLRWRRLRAWAKWHQRVAQTFASSRPLSCCLRKRRRLLHTRRQGSANESPPHTHSIRTSWREATPLPRTCKIAIICTETETHSNIQTIQVHCNIEKENKRTHRDASAPALTSHSTSCTAMSGSGIRSPMAPS